ncbi:hypothetical protein DA103_13305 [Enterobacter cloacae]|jgi:hypothetical protein|uniref:Protein YbjH n=1 Tax=Enterobacter cloacae TaxID=550 RepID=A0A2T4XXZ2_ENTCL|nr:MULTISPECIES: hypothetical protein [Enterobacter]MBO4148264.1 hypothetical protein [Enterobacter ludwigii]HEO9144007.1 hypothetical protein [Enterobacter asburiae]MCR1304883.1 hypothetical protein [Enterobacter sp. FL1277]MCR1306006.1 hypothetical protein [Enterobacter sp. BT1271]MCR1313186.1 hypothetical protein [Enterobacter sp. BT855]
MKKSYIVLAVMAGLAMVNSAMAQSVTVDVPSGYKVVIVPSSTTVPQAVAVAPAPSQTVYAAPAPAPVYHPRARHVASVAEGMVIEHQYDDHH